MSSLIVIGREGFSRAHLKVFRDEELRAIFGELADEASRISLETTVLFQPLTTQVEVCSSRVILPHGVILVSGIDLEIPRSFYVPAVLDGEFLEYLLFDLPRKLDVERKPVIVEDLDQRFTRDANSGIVYALDILRRIAATYKVPVVVSGDRWLEEIGRFTRRIVCTADGKCLVDDEVFCGDAGAQR
ncbi:MAG: hypothetical protein ABWK01_04660 [Infirmifilum sp.]